MATIAVTAFLISSAPPSGAALPPGVIAWGNNQTGELGDGTNVNRTTPVAMVGVTSPTIMSVGEVHGLAVQSGQLVAWGHNKSGQLGNGTNNDANTPMPVAGLSNVVSVAAGNAFSIAVLADGSVKAWGNNQSGQLGNGNAPNDTNTPVDVSGLGPSSGVVAVSAGDAHVLALKSDGSVWAWGNNQTGELGDGSAPTDHDTPVAVSGLGPGSGVVAIASGGSFSLALKADGSVFAWGNNQSGQLGDGTAPTDQPTPVPVKNLGPGGAVRIAAGSTTSYALRSDGTVLAWGNNGVGELGDGNAPQDKHTPQPIPGLGNVVAIAAGSEHALALLGDGTVMAWGDNALGQIGDGTTDRRLTPVKVSGIDPGSGVTAVLAGGGHSHAIITAQGTPPTPPTQPSSGNTSAVSDPAPPDSPAATSVGGTPTVTG
jgi:alpha-tubulin suppressor-like RCC1 family protein